MREIITKVTCDCCGIEICNLTENPVITLNRGDGSPIRLVVNEMQARAEDEVSDVCTPCFIEALQRYEDAASAGTGNVL